MKNMKQVGPAKCSRCGRKMNDVVLVKEGFFSDFRMCDSCLYKAFKLCQKDKKGEAED